MRNWWATACLSAVLASFLVVPGAAGQVQGGTLITEGVPEIPQELKTRLHQYQRVRTAEFEDWLPAQGGILVTTRFAETRQVHLLTEPGGARRQLTFFSEPVEDADACPASGQAGFLFRMDEGGSEQFQIFHYDLSSGWYRMLTDGSFEHGAPAWAPDCETFAFTRRTPEGQEILVYDLDDARSRPVLPPEDFWQLGDWLDEGRFLAYAQRERQLYVVDLAGGRVPQAVRNMGGPPLPAADGRGFYFSQRGADGPHRLMYHDGTTGVTRPLTRDMGWEVERYARSDDGRWLAFSVNQAGESVLYLMNLVSGDYATVPGVPTGVIDDLAFHPDGDWLGATLRTAGTAGDVFVIDVATREVTQWTYSEIGGLPEGAFAKPLLVQYPTFDSVNGQPRTISAYYLQPPGDGPFPVLISLHGGPALQARPDFEPVEQFLVNELGIAVLAPNVRGSSGYGQAFRDLDNEFQREGAVKDVGALLGWIAARPELDESRVAVQGGSYGGYLALSAMARYGTRIRAGIDFWGISDFSTFMGSFSERIRDAYYRPEYGDERDPAVQAFFQRISPVAMASRIRAPLLVAQGQNDPRVPPSQSEQVVRAVRDNGQTVWYVLATDEGHGFSKQSNNDYLIQSAVLFLKTHLLGAAAPTGTPLRR